MNCFQNYYIWTNYNNSKLLSNINDGLWIAFRIIIFEPTITTAYCDGTPIIMLWIAFRIIIFEPTITTYCMILLTVSVLWIAFRIIIFEPTITTKNAIVLYNSKLWIAFRIIIFEPTITTFNKRRYIWAGCELLSELLYLNQL